MKTRIKPEYKLPPIACNICGHKELTIELMDRHFDVHRAPLHRVADEGASVVTSIPERPQRPLVVTNSDPIPRVSVPRGRNREIIENVMSTQPGPMTLEQISKLALLMNDKLDTPGVWQALNVIAAQGKVRRIKRGVYEWIKPGVSRPTSVQQPVGTIPPVIQVRVRESILPPLPISPVLPASSVPSHEYPVQELIARAQREAEQLAKTLGELNGVIGPFLGAIKAVLGPSRG